MYQLIVFDMDGTLLTSKKTISQLSSQVQQSCSSD